MPLIFAITPRGLEDIAVEEMSGMKDIRITEKSYRRITAEVKSLDPSLLSFRTLDDIFLFAYHWKNIPHTRDALKTLQAISAEWKLEVALRLISSVRKIDSSARFSVSVSFVGKRNYSSVEMKDAVSKVIANTYGWIYQEDDKQADLNIRLFIEHQNAYVGIRIGKTPLQERSYKEIHRLGALKPPIAACMLAMADIQKGQTVIDPCCGTGTILFEAASYLDCRTFGGDIDALSVQAAAKNAMRVEAHCTFFRWDVRSLPVANTSIDRVVSNFPWGRQIKTDDELGEFYRHANLEIQRILKPGGRFVCLTTQSTLLNSSRLTLKIEKEISLNGQRPKIAIYEKEV